MFGADRTCAPRPAAIGEAIGALPVIDMSDTGRRIEAIRLECVGRTVIQTGFGGATIARTRRNHSLRQVNAFPERQPAAPGMP